MLIFQSTKVVDNPTRIAQYYARVQCRDGLYIGRMIAGMKIQQQISKGRKKQVQKS